MSTSRKCTLRRHLKKVERAIAFQRKFFEKSKRLPTFSEVAKRIGVSQSRPCGWLDFTADRRALTVAGAPDNRRGSRPTGKEQLAIAYQTEILKASGRLPPLDQIAKKVGVSVNTACRWDCLRAVRGKYEAAGTPVGRRGRPSGKEDRAIAFQKDVFDKSHRLPTFKQVAAYVPTNITGICSWPRFMDARTRARSRRGASNRLGHPMGKESAAVDFQKEFFARSGRLPTYKVIAGHVRVQRQTPERWPQFMAARRVLEASGAPSNRLGHPTGKESAAVDFQKEFFARSGRLPTYKEIATHARVDPTTPYAWRRLRDTRCEIQKKAGLAPKITAWGTPRHSGEAAAVVGLEKIFGSSQRAPGSTRSLKRWATAGRYSIFGWCFVGPTNRYPASNRGGTRRRPTAGAPWPVSRGLRKSFTGPDRRQSAPRNATKKS